MHKVLTEVTEAIAKRSLERRQRYLAQIDQQARNGRDRARLSCGNLAHTVAACSAQDKETILNFERINVGIITAYNDMLSAHQPYQYYPERIKQVLQPLGHSAQVAGGVPAMCDGVTQGQPGMDLSLFSRDLIAQSTAIGLSHNSFDATLLLGICDKIAPGQLIGALSFGHLPTAFVPAGPMPTGISNEEKVKVRQQYAKGDVGQEALQQMECSAYHAPGTCTFYGTANTNQLVFEAMGLMLPGSAFIPPNTALRQRLTDKIATHMPAISYGSDDYRPLGRVLDEKALVNGLVALLASGGSTNHTIHMIALARAAGLILTWDDFSALSDEVPLLARVYPNGPADINSFQQAGGVPALLQRLAQRGLLHMDALPVFGSMEDYLRSPELGPENALYWQEKAPVTSAVIATDQAFNTSGGLKVLAGNLGRGVIKTSAVDSKYHQIEAPVRVFSSQHDVEAAYRANELNRDLIVVVRHNGPAANGMPELHKLMPLLANLQQAGHKVALVTDGRLSGASGKVPAVIHMTPEAQHQGPLAYLQDGDIVRLDVKTGTIETTAELNQRAPATLNLESEHLGCGRELFDLFRDRVSSAETGASIFR